MTAKAIIWVVILTQTAGMLFVFFLSCKEVINTQKDIETYEKKILLIESKDCSVCAHAGFCYSNPPDESGVNYRSWCRANAKANFFPEEDKKLFVRRG